MIACYLDMDGVLVDFANAAIAAFDAKIPRADVRWDFPKDLGFRHGGDPDFWGKLGREFWATLPWTAEGRGLLAGLESLFNESICLVSTPADGSPDCREGKADWVERNTPAYRRRLFLGAEKFRLASPWKVLIDDHEPNVEAFAAHGGQAVLVPRPWNSRRGLTDGGGDFPVPALLEEVKAARGAAQACYMRA